MTQPAVTHIRVLGSDRWAYCSRSTWGYAWVFPHEADIYDRVTSLCKVCVKSLARCDRERAASGNPRQERT